MARKMTWALVIWTGLFVYVLSSGATTPGCGANEACQTGVAIGTGLSFVILFPIWFIGFIVLSILWFMSRPSGPTVKVYGPEGQEVMLREPEAERRVRRPGWGYTPRT